MVEGGGPVQCEEALYAAGHTYLEDLRKIGVKAVHHGIAANTYASTNSLPDLAREAGPLSGDSEADNGEDN